MFTQIVKRLGGKAILYNIFFCGGGVVLVNSGLNALPTYITSLCGMPMRIDALRRNFIWQGNKE